MAARQERSLPSVVLPPPMEAGFPSSRQWPCAALLFPLFWAGVFMERAAWSFYSPPCIEYLFSPKVIRPFMILYSLVAILGATVDLGLLWSIADTFNGLMSIPNLIALFLLSGTVVKLVKEHFEMEG